MWMEGVYNIDGVFQLNIVLKFGKVIIKNKI